MLVRTDDEVYRIDAVWLGPPRATFPWRARYVSYGVGLLVMMLIMFVQRRLGVPLDFFSVAWALVGTVAVTRLLGKKISYERPFGQVVAQFWSEVVGPRRRTSTGGGPLRTGHVRVRATRSGPPSPRRGERTPAAAPAVAATPARPAAVAARRDPRPAERARRAAPVRTTPDGTAWASRRTRTSQPGPERRTGTSKGVRRGRA